MVNALYRKPSNQSLRLQLEIAIHSHCGRMFPSAPEAMMAIDNVLCLKNLVWSLPLLPAQIIHSHCMLMVPSLPDDSLKQCHIPENIPHVNAIAAGADISVLLTSDDIIHILKAYEQITL